ncbi:MAG: HdeD family acid-resistance protein [Terriglobales bacterium]
MVAQPSSLLRQASGWSIVWGVLLIVFGILAIGAPLLAAVAVTALIAWLIILAGVIHLVVAFHAHGAGSLIWKLLVGLAYICIGGYLLMHPLLGVASLTLLLASLFLIEGALDVVLYFKLRPGRGAGWVLFDGLVTLVLALFIGFHWPSSSVWAIGTLVGVSMIMSGVTRLMMSVAVRKLTENTTLPKAA